MSENYFIIRNDKNDKEISRKQGNDENQETRSKCPWVAVHCGICSFYTIKRYLCSSQKEQLFRNYWSDKQAINIKMLHISLGF